MGGAQTTMNGEGKSGISRTLSSLWNTNSEKDETCVSWGLVSGRQGGLCSGRSLFLLLPQTKKERIIGFFTCLALGALCFGLVGLVF